MKLNSERVFITGGSGFIGGRLVELLARQQGLKVRAMVTRPSAGALRMARFPIEFSSASITDVDAMAVAMDGCDTVFHLAYGKHGTSEERYEITVNGTRVVCEAAVRAGVKTLVNVSTAAVYPDWPDGLVTEESRRAKWGWSYADEKFQAEEIVLSQAREGHFSGSVVQVAGVYGPWGETFTIEPLRQLKAGLTVLPGEGKGYSHATYVDDVVGALIAVANSPEAANEIFLVKGNEDVERLALFRKYEEMLGVSNLVPLHNSEIDAYLKDRKSRVGLIQLARQALGVLAADDGFKDCVRNSSLAPVARQLNSRVSLPAVTNSRSDVPVFDALGEVQVPPRFMWDRLASRAVFSTEKLKALTGFEPRISFDRGMELTAQWAAWARLL
jgi:nucleoside-diphosphate-sugar epimerase